MPFALQKEIFVPELESRVRLYRHEPTGARLLSIINNDENKVFGINFRTPPEHSDGVAHIIEHSVLCGSRKYPVKEPFVELMKGSLNTFLNAMTYPDKTCYPVASANLKDFYNLIDVYLDAVFYPNLTRTTFMQEGWHYEIDPATKNLSYKGVVFNEMKGAYSDPDDQHEDLCRRSLYPDTPYGLDSGGDPLVIPSLTYENFVAFHKKYYHPANSFIFFYGDDDPERRLGLMEEWLAPFGREEIDSLPAAQPAFTEPRRFESYYQTNTQDEPKAYSAINWSLYEHGDSELSMKTTMLVHILMGTPASPLRKALIESGLGEDLAGFGLSEELRQAAFSIGLKGVRPAKVAEVEKLVLSTLEKLSRDGIDAETVAASLNTIEFALREKNTGRFPRGLAIMLDTLNEWLYDKDPVAALSFAGPLEHIKHTYEQDPRMFSELIDTLFLRNPHRTTVTLLPSPDAGRQRDEAELTMLTRASASFDAKKLEAIERNAEELEALQNRPDTPEALATIPVLSLGDIPKEAPALPSERIDLSATTSSEKRHAAPRNGAENGRLNGQRALSPAEGSPVRAYYHELPTSGILYLDLGFDFGALQPELLPYVSLLGRFMLEMGTDKESFVQLTQRIGTHTGGIRSTAVATTRWSDRKPAPWFFVRAKALAEKADVLAEILADVLARARFADRERVRQIVLEEKAQAEAMLVPASARIVGLRLRSRYNPSDWASERLYGVEYLFFLRTLAQRIEKDWPSVLAEMEAVRRALITRDNLIVNVTADRSSLNASAPAIARLVSALPGSNSMAPRATPADVTEPATVHPPVSNDAWPNVALAACAAAASRPASETLELPTQVNSVGMVLPLQNLDAIAGGAYVASKYLDATYLWERVRVMGGAYGGFSNLDLTSRLFMLLSYRDPNLEKTIGVYRSLASHLKSCLVSKEEIQKAIIGTIGEVDAYQLPDAKGFNALMNELTGYTQERRQTIRDQILSTDLGDFHRLGELIEAALPSSMLVAMAAPERIEKAGPSLPGPIERRALY